MSTKSKIEVDATPLPSPIPQISTWLNYSPDEAHVYEFVSGVSDTIPEMGVDLRLMLERSAQGIPVPTRNDGYSEDDYPDIFKMDEFELADFRENLAHDMQRMKDDLHIASKRLEEIEDEQRKKVVTEPSQNAV